MSDDDDLRGRVIAIILFVAGAVLLYYGFRAGSTRLILMGVFVGGTGVVIYTDANK